MAKEIKYNNILISREKDKVNEKTKTLDNNYILESEKKIPISRRVDVIVVGGGTAGIIAAIASARAGAKTLVVERQHWLGGHITSGVDFYPSGLGDRSRIVAGSIAKEIIEAVDSMGGVSGDPKKDVGIFLDLEILKYVLDQKFIQEENLDVLYDCWFAEAIVEDEKIKGIIIETKSGRQAILGNTVIDCSGDADVAAKAGAPFAIESRNNIQPVSVLAKISNVDIGRLSHDIPPTKPYPGLYKGYDSPQISYWKPLDKFLQEAKQKGELDSELEYMLNWFFYLVGPTALGELLLIITGEHGIWGIDNEDITRALIISRKRVQDAIALLKKYIPAFANSFISATGTLGVRETRRIIGEYTLTKGDILSCKHFNDVVARGTIAPGPHTPDGGDLAQPESEHTPPPLTWEIPLRCLIPQKIDSLMVAGRCISVEHAAHGGIRVMGACLATGQAAGVTAALASKQGITVRKVSASEVQSLLKEQGVDLSSYKKD